LANAPFATFTSNGFQPYNKQRSSMKTFLK